MSSPSTTPTNTKTIEAWLLWHNSMAPQPHIPRSRSRFYGESCSPEPRIGSLPTRRRLRFDDSESPVRASTPTAVPTHETTTLLEKYVRYAARFDFNGNQQTPSEPSPYLSDEGCCSLSSGDIDYYKTALPSFGKRKNFDMSDVVPTKLSRFSSSAFDSVNSTCSPAGSSATINESSCIELPLHSTGDRLPMDQSSHGDHGETFDYDMSM